MRILSSMLLRIASKTNGFVMNILCPSRNTLLPARFCHKCLLRLAGKFAGGIAIKRDIIKALLSTKY